MIANRSTLMPISPILPEDEYAVLALNNAHAAELSWLDAQRLSHLLASSFYARRIGALEAFIMAFDQDDDYDGQNFQWFRQRYSRFAYVDRIAVAAHARGRGHARRLYEDLFAKAKLTGHAMVTCEINSDPPNPSSDAFHASLGFIEVGTATLESAGKSVRYFICPLDR